MYSILLVDDEPLALRGLKLRVRYGKIGIDSVYEASDADEAKEIFQTHHIDLLLCDIELPGDSGLDLAQWVNDNYPGTVILFLTCHAEFSYARDAVRLMAFRYLLKPIAYTELEQTLEEAIQKQLSPAEIQKNVGPQDAALAVERTIVYIRNNLSHPLSREELGKNVFLNPNYLARIFKEQVGTSLFSYIIDQRLKYAALLLKSTNMRINVICEAIGIDDNSYFSKLFKKKYGKTPRQFRLEYQGETNNLDYDE